MEDPSSSFFLHHGETPRAILVPHPLVGDNFLTWAKAMKLAMDAKSKLSFINGSITTAMAVYLRSKLGQNAIR